MRKQRYTTKEWLRYIANLDRVDQRKELTQRQIKARYAEHQADLDYYYAAFQSPCRNCAGWVQELQNLQVEGFEKAVNKALATG